MTVIRSEIRKAKKKYHDDSREWIESSELFPLNWDFEEDGELSEVAREEWEIVNEARNRGWKILPGMEYRYQFIVEDGDRYSYRSTEAILAICKKYDVFDV